MMIIQRTCNSKGVINVEFCEVDGMPVERKLVLAS